MSNSIVLSNKTEVELDLSQPTPETTKWLFLCSKCGYRIEQDDVIEGKCPYCGASAWLSHLLEETGHKHFDSRRDREIIEVSGFFCQACAVGKPASEQSPDPRYCQGCYEFLLKEAELLTGTKRPKWIPKPQTAPKKQYPISVDGASIMSTVEGKKFEVDIIQPSVAIRAVVKRGPKHRQLPEDLIRQLASEGMGSKVIAARLKAEYGVIVSYKTIQRILSGERKQLALPMSAP
jgi:hypothetical protein